MRKRREIQLFSISFLDLLSGALGAVIILYVAIPKSKPLPAPDNSKAVLARELEDSRLEIQELKKQIAFSKPVEKPPVIVEERHDLDIGFKFKGKNIVFIIDTSFSMTDEDRMSQVKAGLKMLLTSMTPSYKVEVVQFPQGERAPFKSMWGTLRELNSSNKLDAFDFIFELRPAGGTPTRDVLLFVLKNYEDTTDIILLTDGAPSLHNSNKKDDIYDLLTNVRKENLKKVQINAIGVGSNLIKDKTSDPYKFLSLLAEQNNGFFVGF